MSTKAAIYLRISLDQSGERLAIQRQREDCLKICEQRGWQVVKEYVDNSISASKAGKVRPEYNRLVADYKAGHFEALVCWDLDRLTRQPRQLEDWVEAAEHRGLLLVTASGEADLTTDNGRLFARIKAAVARAEVERKSARQKRAQRQRAELGKPPAGPRLTGYSQAGEVIEEEARMVRELFNRFSSGDSLRSLCTWAQEEGFKPRSGTRAWNPTTIRQLLTNPRYAGFSTYKGEQLSVPGQWEPLVTPEQFAVVQSILSDPRRITNHTGTHRRYLGSGLYVCDVCGEKVSSWSGRRYRCKNGCCSRSGTQIDALVVAVVHERLQDPDLVKLLAAPRDNGKLSALTAKVEAARARLVAIEADYDAGLIDGRRFSVASEKVTAELQEAERAQVELIASVGPASVIGAPNPAAAFDAAPLGIQQRIISLLIKEVRLGTAPRGRKQLDPASVRFVWH